MGLKVVSNINEAIVDCKRDPDVEMWEREVIRDFGSRLQVALVEMESDFEKHKEGSSSVRECFVGALTQLQLIPTLLPKGIILGKRAQEFLVNIWTIGLKFLDGFVQKNKDALMIDSWSLGATVGFPIVVAGMFSVTFKA